MPEVRVAAQPRTEFGKGAARRTRRADLVPAVVYGHGTETRHVTVGGHELMMALKTRNALIRLDGVPGLTGLTLPKAVQRDPIKGFIQHADFLLVRQGEKVVVDIEIRVTGDVIPGGMLDQPVIQIPVAAEATHIPDGIEIDVTGLPVGTQVTAGELSLPAGVALAADPDLMVVHVVAERTAEEVEAELEAAEEQAGVTPTLAPEQEAPQAATATAGPEAGVEHDG